MKKKTMMEKVNHEEKSCCARSGKFNHEKRALLCAQLLSPRRSD
jgi:hypothetical protein